MYPFSFDEFLSKYRYPLFTLLFGVVLTLSGAFIIKSNIFTPETKVEVLSANTEGVDNNIITVEIAGAVIKPGVYKLMFGERVEDLLTVSGGLSADADRAYVEKNINRAVKLSDGQKVYIPTVSEQSKQSSAKSGGGDQTISTSILTDSNELLNINTSSMSELDALPGIGQTYAQKIIEHRPYSTVEELLSKAKLPKSVYEKVKIKVRV